MAILNILLVYYTINSILAILLKTKFDCLSCGLFCYVGKETADPWKLKILALYNQSRGEHSTGVCVDDVVIKDTITAKEFLVKSGEAFNFHKYEIKNHVFLGHCRQATHMFSKDNVNYAHPHETALAGKDFLRLVHNGSVTNCHDLAHKYDINNTNKSDSMLIAEILTKFWNNKELNLLKEYDGSATLVFYPLSTPDTLYVHKDKFRELFYWKESATGCYISSIKASLVAIGAPLDKVIEFNDGILYKFVGAKITKTWDVKDKNPYEIPKKPRVFASPTSKTTKKQKNQNSDGFVWEDHRILHNGHAYTGEMYISKKDDSALKSITIEQKPHYDVYYVIHGHCMLNKAKYEELYRECTIENMFSFAQFNSLFLSKLQAYTKYPVLGRIFAPRDVKFFWTPETKKLNNMEDLYEWSPVLSNTTFSIDKAGYLRKENENALPVTVKQVIEELIDKRVQMKKMYQSVNELYNEVKATPGVELKALNVSKFVDDLIEVFSRSAYVQKATIGWLERQRVVEGYAHMAEDFVDWDFLSKVSEVLNDYLQALLLQNSDKNVDVETYLADQIVDNYHEEDIGYYKTPDWKDEIIFGNYEKLEDVLTTFLTTEEPQFIKPLYRGLANLFVDLGLLTEGEVEPLLNKSTTSAKFELARIFEQIKEERCVTMINKLFENADVTEGFAKLFDEYLGLEAKNALSKKEDLKFTIIKTGLKYIQRKATSLDLQKLTMKFNITPEEIKAACS